MYNYVLNTYVLEKVDVVRDLGVYVDSFLKFDRHISFIVHKAMTRARLILKCFLSRDRELLFKAYCVYVRPLLEYCSAVWSPHLKCLVVKMESVQRFFTKRLQGMWNKGYNDRLKLLNTHSLEYRRLYSSLCAEQVCTHVHQGRSDGLPPKKSVQVNFLCGKNDVRTAIEHEY